MKIEYTSGKNPMPSSPAVDRTMLRDRTHEVSSGGRLETARNKLLAFQASNRQQGDHRDGEQQ